MILQRGYGSAGANGRVSDTSTIFPAGSISKQFTAATILALANTGKIRLDARVGKYQPEFFADEPDLRVVILTNKGFLWLTELMPALLGDAPAALATATASPLSGHFEDGLFRFDVTPDGAARQEHIDLIDTLRFVPAAPRVYVAETYPATFRIRLPADGSRDRFECDWGELRSYARRVKP